MVCKMALTKDFIIGRSIEILNRDGIDGLTMRLLAKELNIKAPSLYWHFSDKAELFAAISEKLCERMDLPERTAAPSELLTYIFSRFREILLSVRDSVYVFENSVPFTPKRLELIRMVADAFLRMGIRPENLVTVSNMFNNYVLSFTADESRFKATTGDLFDEFAGKLEQRDRLVFAVPHDFDGQFAYGLMLLFEGLERVKHKSLTGAAADS